MLPGLLMKGAIADAKPFDVVSAPLVRRPHCGEIPKRLAGDIDGPATPKVVAIAAAGDLAVVVYIPASCQEPPLATRKSVAATTKALTLPDDRAIVGVVATPPLSSVSDESREAELHTRDVDRTPRPSDLPPKAAT